MNKKIIGIVVGCVLIAGLAGATVLLLNTGDENTSPENQLQTTEAVDDVILSSQSPDSVTKISVKNEKDEYTVIRKTKANEKTSESAVYTIDGLENIKTDTSLLGTLANNVATLSVSGNNIIEKDSSELDKFGLGDTATSVTMEFDDGSKFSFRIGDVVHNDSTTYFSVEGQNTVYGVQTSLLANFEKASTDFISRTVLEKPSDEDMPTIETVKLDRKDLENPFVLTHKENANNDKTGGTIYDYVMTEPISAKLSSERSDNIIKGLFGLTAEVVTPNPSKTDLEKAGLADPFATLAVSCDDGNEYTLLIGNRYTEEDEAGTTIAYYPVYLDGNNIIYRLSEDKCGWATISATDIASKLIFITYIWDVSSLDVSVGDKQVSFTSTGDNKEEAVVKKNGVDCDTERYRLFYSFLLNTSAEEVVMGDVPAGKPDAEIVIKTHDNKENIDITFYKKDEFNTLIAIDGVLSFQCRTSYLETLEHNIDIFDTEETFTTSWR